MRAIKAVERVLWATFVMGPALLAFVSPRPVEAASITVSPTNLQLTFGSNKLVAGQQTVGVNFGQDEAPYGYNVTISVVDRSGESPYTAGSLVNDRGASIAPLLGATQQSPLALISGTWGYAVPGLGGFDQAYEANPATSSLWAGLPLDKTTDIIGATSAPGNNNYEVWFGVRGAETMMLAGDYVAEIVYTATANPIEPARLDGITPNAYNLGDETVPAEVVIAGSNLITASQVCLTPTDSSSTGCEAPDAIIGEIISQEYGQLVVDFPNNLDESIVAADQEIKFDVWVDNNNGVGEHQCAQLRGAFTYTRQMAIAGVSPSTFNLDDDDRPIEMAGGSSHRIILTQSGQVFTTTTNNDHGQLGIGNTSNDGGIYNITSRFDGKVVSVSAGGNYSLALTDGGRVYSWGANNCAQLGNGNQGECSNPDASTEDKDTSVAVSIPTDITDNFNLPAGRKIIKIYAGWRQAFAIANDGTLYAWGLNHHGQLGLGTTGGQRTLPEVVNFAFNGNIVDLATDSHVLVLTDQGFVYSWGLNSNGQLGVGGTDDSNTPVEITSLRGQGVVQVETSSNGSFARTNDGQLYAWGQNDYGNLGFGEKIIPDQSTTVIVWNPQPVNAVYRDDYDTVEQVETPRLSKANEIIGRGIKDLAVGFHKVVAIANDGRVFTWGDNQNGVLGIAGDTGDEYNICDRSWGLQDAKNCSDTHYAKRGPVHLGSNYDNKFESVFASGEALFAIGVDGSVYSWGNGGTPDADGNNITGDINYQQATIMGANMPLDMSVFIDIDGDKQPDGDEMCVVSADSESRRTSTRIYCAIPTAASNTTLNNISAGGSAEYAILGQTSSGNLVGLDDSGNPAVKFRYYRN